MSEFAMLFAPEGDELAEAVEEMRAAMGEANPLARENRAALARMLLGSYIRPIARPDLLGDDTLGLARSGIRWRAVCPDGSVRWFATPEDAIAAVAPLLFKPLHF